MKRVIQIIFWGVLTTLIYKAFGWWGIGFEVLIVSFLIIIWWDDLVKRWKPKKP